MDYTFLSAVASNNMTITDFNPLILVWSEMQEELS